MTRYGTAQEDAKQGYTEDVNKANHSCGRFAEGQPSSSSLNILTAAPVTAGQGHSLEGTVHKGHQITPGSRWCEGGEEGTGSREGPQGDEEEAKQMGETEMASDLQEQLGWLPQGRYSNITSGEEKFHIEPPSYRPAPPARDRPVLPSIAQGPLVQA